MSLCLRCGCWLVAWCLSLNQYGVLHLCDTSEHVRLGVVVPASDVHHGAFWTLAGDLMFEPQLIWCAAFVQHLGACEFGGVAPASDVHHGAIWAQDKNCCRIRAE